MCLLDVRRWRLDNGHANGYAFDVTYRRRDANGNLCLFSHFASSQHNSSVRAFNTFGKPQARPRTSSQGEDKPPPFLALLSPTPYY